MPKIKPKIREATLADHKELVRIAKQSKYTSAFSNMIFSGEDCYAAGRIRVAVLGGQLVGFTCFRHRKRNPATVLYFVAVDSSKRGRGIGTELMRDLDAVSIGVVEFKVMKDNSAVRLYKRLGFADVGEALDGNAWVMRNDVDKKKPQRIRLG